MHSAGCVVTGKSLPMGLLASEPWGRPGKVALVSRMGKESCMIGYLTRRVVQAVIVVIGVCAITFILYHLFPGGANSEARIILGPRATPGSARFVHTVRTDSTSRSGRSSGSSSRTCSRSTWATRTSSTSRCATIILQKLPKTVLLLGLATLVTVIVAIPLGIFQVLRRNKPSDYALDDAVVHLLRDADVLSRHRPHPVVRHPLAHLPARGAARQPRSGRSWRTGRRSCCRSSRWPPSTSPASADICAHR